jgi:hypothetical protein
MARDVVYLGHNGGSMNGTRDSSRVRLEIAMNRLLASSERTLSTSRANIIAWP